MPDQTIAETSREAEISTAATTSAQSPYADVDLHDLTVRGALLSALDKEIPKLKDAHRLELARRMRRGSKLTAHDPADEMISYGTVSLSNPKPEAYITDIETFDAYCRELHPDKVEPWVEYIDPDAVAALVAEHAPHLLRLHQTVPSELREDILRRAAVETVPGTGRRLPSPSLTVRTTKHATEAVHALFGGNPVLKALELPQ